MRVSQGHAFVFLQLAAADLEELDDKYRLVLTFDRGGGGASVSRRQARAVTTGICLFA